MIIRYALVAALISTLTLAGLLYKETVSASNARFEMVQVQGELSECKGRLTNVQEDRIDDATVDSPSFSAPCEWMFEGCK